MLHPVPGASGVCPSCPRPSADVRRAQEVAGDQQIENSLAPKLMGEVISKVNFILTESCLGVCLASCSGGGCNHCSIICCHLTVSGYWLIINQKKLVIIRSGPGTTGGKWVSTKGQWVWVTFIACKLKLIIQTKSIIDIFPCVGVFSQGS